MNQEYKGPPKLGEVYEIISRWIRSCVTEEQLYACSSAIENCISNSRAWDDESEDAVKATVEMLLRSVKQREGELFVIATMAVPPVIYHFINDMSKP